MQQQTNQQPESSAPQASEQKSLSWMPVVSTLGKLALLYLTGPAPANAVTLRLAIATGHPYHKERQWEEHTAVAVLLPVVLYASLWYLRAPFTWAWSGMFATVAG